MQTVVMVVANDVSIDVRVRKMAASVARNHKVYVLGLSSSGKRSSFELDGFEVILLSVVNPQPLKLRVRKALGRRIMKLSIGPAIRQILKSKPSQKKPVPDALRTTDTNVHQPWREVLPETTKYESVFGAELEKIRPDLVHAQDIHLLSVAANYVKSRKQAGGKCALIYDAHEYVRGLGSIDPKRRDAYADLESEYIGLADSIVTVSGSIATRIQHDHNLLTKPYLVLNAPSQSKIQPSQSSPSVRKVCGLDPDVPLVIYSGGIHISRGMDLLVSSLEYMPGVHLAMTSNRESWYIEELKLNAAGIGAANRLHFVPYVSPEEVVQYISTATIGISPLPADVVNYDLALPNKLFDYIQAGLPLVVSNCSEVTNLLEKFVLGETFNWQDPKDLARAVIFVLSQRSEFLSNYIKYESLLEEFTWETQEVELGSAYAKAFDSSSK
jgi:glycosyltransferase involved in cell wall biosynthesis